MSKKSPNILLIDKPKGITSYDVIRQLKKQYPSEKIGHSGTLDPRASGLLLVGVGKGTKELHELVGLGKEYIADILLGIKTDTGDLDGKIVESKAIERIERDQIGEALKGMEGVLTLPVSAYSAIKRGGEPLYKKARRGETVEPPMREMEVTEAQLLPIEVRLQSELKSDFNLGVLVVRVRFVVGSGTYVRSLAEELGRRLGVPATLAELRRTRIGEYKVEDATSI